MIHNSENLVSENLQLSIFIVENYYVIHEISSAKILINVSTAKIFTYAIRIKLSIIILYVHRLGPLTNTWCMRMEANYFKKTAQLGNFKNIALSVSNRHQKFMCALLNSRDFLINQLSSMFIICCNIRTCVM